jgi:2-polyprenyl-3-methyl-5-hydroxy-6-metoxy-1,4-benzoquinol methylase
VIGGGLGRAAVELYAGLPAPARLHVRLRWLSCPFPAVAAAVPKDGRVLEIGCGHGLFSAYLALGSAERRVCGVDIDAAKIQIAEEAAGRARARGAHLSFAVAPSGSVPSGPWDAVVIVDVLYLLDAPAQRALLAACAQTLAPGGVLVVKEMGTTPRWKFRWNLAQETLAVKVLGITAGHSFTFLPPAAVAATLADCGLTASVRAVDGRRPHPHALIVGRRLPDRAADD